MYEADLFYSKIRKYTTKRETVPADRSSDSLHSQVCMDETLFFSLFGVSTWCF